MKHVSMILLFLATCTTVCHGQSTDSEYRKFAQQALDSVFPGQYRVEERVPVIRQGDFESAHRNSAVVFTTDGSKVSLDGVGRMFAFRRANREPLSGKDRFESEAAVSAEALRVLQRAGVPEDDGSGAEFELKSVIFSVGERWQPPTYRFEFVKRPFGFDAGALGGASGVIHAVTGEITELYVYRGWTFERPNQAISEQEAVDLVVARYGGRPSECRVRTVYLSMISFRDDATYKNLIDRRVARLCYEVAWPEGSVYVDSVTGKLSSSEVPVGRKSMGSDGESSEGGTPSWNPLVALLLVPLAGVAWMVKRRLG